MFSPFDNKVNQKPTPGPEKNKPSAFSLLYLCWEFLLDIFRTITSVINYGCVKNDVGFDLQQR